MKFLAKCNLSHHRDPIRHFIEGLKKHGHTDIDFINIGQLQSRSMNNAGIKYDVGILWGVRKLDAMRKEAKNVIVIENSYLNNVQTKDGKYWLSFGWNGLNGHADFCNKNSPNDRWKKHFNDGRLLDYSDGEYILIPLQIKGDMSLVGRGFAYQSIVDEIRKYSDLPIRIKQHPTADDGWPLISGHKDIKYLDRFMPIHEAIKGAKVVVTINSNAGVDAVIGGKPVVALDEGSMVYDIAEHDFTKLLVPNWPDRTQWCNDIAYTQWTPEEVAKGETWEHLKQYLCTNKET
jgi:hypothetical protein